MCTMSRIPIYSRTSLVGAITRPPHSIQDLKHLLVCTVAHVNHLNVAFGFCAITALGSFDHTLGGHLILYDLNEASKFPL